MRKLSKDERRILRDVLMVAEMAEKELNTAAPNMRFVKLRLNDATKMLATFLVQR